MDGVDINLLEKAEDCVYHSRNKLVKSLECYSEISINNIIYQTGEFIVLKSSAQEPVGQILCFYLNENLICEAIISRFFIANKFKTLFDSEGYTFDKYNEVVQDTSNYYLSINLSDILRKCNLMILTVNEDPLCIQKKGLDRSVNFFWRFKIKSDKLCPLLPIGTEVLIQSNINNNSTVRSEMKDHMQTPNIENNCKKHVNIDKVAQKHSVRRNLNSSFTDIANYSVIDTEDDESLKIKLRKSRQYESRNSPSVRKSTRSIPRKCYVDYEYESPKKGRKVDDGNQLKNQCKTPRRNLNKTEFMKIDEVKIKIHNENVIIKNSPKMKRKDSYLNVEIPKESSTTSLKTSSKDNSNLRTPKRSIKNNNEITPRCLKRTNFEMDEVNCDLPLKDNLNDSLRTQILKVKLENLNLSDLQISDNKIIGSEQQSATESSPRTRRKAKNIESEESDLEWTPSTPKSKMNRTTMSKLTPINKTPTRSPSKTPSGSKAKLIRKGIITPSMQSRQKTVKNNTTPLMKARSQLHVSYVPKSLPCREKEYEDVYKFLEDKLLDGFGGCMYISGVPGTGKTATVTCVISNLQQNEALPDFTFVNLNAMRLTEPRQSYVEILKQLTGKSASWEQAQSQLEEIFMKSKRLKPVVMLIDELDILCTKRQDVVYNLLDWPTKVKNQLIVITIANTMDLPERLLMSRVASRLGLTRLTFQAYTYKQLQEIVMKRLCGIDSFNPDAVQFVARKVAAVSGDARRALDICRRAAEIAEAESGSQLVNMNHVNEALNAMIAQPKVQAIKHCSKLERLILQAIVAEVERTGVEETTFSDVYKMLVSVAVIDGFRMVSMTVALLAVSKLSSCRLIITDQKCNDIHQRIVLNVSVDDVYFALKEHNE